jgi:hypothetical protein
MKRFSYPLRYRAYTGVVLAAALLASSGNVAYAVSSWNPTTLVNTESFQMIDRGDGTTNIELQFGATNQTIKFLTTNKFQFSHSISVIGNLSGSSLTIDGLRSCDTIDTDAAGNFVCGTDTGGLSQTAGDARYVNTSGDTMTGSLRVRGNLSGSTLNVDGNASFNGALTTSGAITTKSNSFTINSGNNSTDDTLTFGNTTASQTLKYSHANQRFEFSKDVKVTGGVRASGNLSGSTLNVDGTFNWRGQSYTAPTSQSANTFLKTDGAGNLTWSAQSTGNSSGNILSLHPEYPNAVYTASGAASVGQLTYSGALGTDNFYRWSTSKATLQNYLVAIRVQVPANFSHWETASGMLVRLRTATTSAADNHVTVRVLDTNGANVAIGNNASLRSSTANTWRTNTVTGLSSAGTFTPLGYMTILVKVAATSAGITDLGYINLRWSTTVP